MLSRRNFVLGASGMALNAALPLCARAAATRRNALKIPKLIEGTTGNGKIYELGIEAGNTRFLPDLSTPTIGINGAYLGPTIRASAGDRVTMRVKNNLTEPTTLHWHGLHIPARHDGGPHQVINPGEFGNRCSRSSRGHHSAGTTLI
jgi:FtsP/CotA-like multicopper oxidase with cupredoxin domain